MRRKSERNKAKGSPEKKVEKPTRRITRRRGRASPSPVSPERENTEDTVTSTPYSEDDKDSRLQADEQQDGNAGLAKDVSSSELIKSVLGGDEEDNVSVWKVARADASPGEIQKLKLCRQRNISETSTDSSLSKTKSNKWPDSGEGGMEEADSVNEQAASSQMTASEQTDDPSSSHPGQDSNEEVSDYKENLPETTSANLSDDKTNIDQQADFKENLQESTSINYTEQPVCEDTQSSSSTNIPGDNLIQPSNYTDIVAEPSTGNSPNNELNEKLQDNTDQQPCFDSNATESQSTTADLSTSYESKSANEENNITTPDECSTTNDENNITTPDECSTTNDKNNISTPDECTAANDENNVSTPNECTDVNDDGTINEVTPAEQSIVQISTDVSTDEPVASCEDNTSAEEATPKQDLTVNQETLCDESNSEIVLINNETNDTDFAESRKEVANDEEEEEEEEGEIRDEVEKASGLDSDSTSNVGESSVADDVSNKESSTRKTRLSRRKQKYRESSSPDTPESEQNIQDKVKEVTSTSLEDSKSKTKKEKKDEKKSKSDKTKEDSVSNNSEIDLLDQTIEKEDILEITEKSDDLNVSLSTSKPTKVSLKRSFSNRLSIDSETNKEENTSKKASSSGSNQNKENHVDNEQPDQKKRRRWGVTATTDVAPAFSISTDSLKALVPGAKPLSVNEVKLTKDEDDEKEVRSRKIASSPDNKPKTDVIIKTDTVKKGQPKIDNHIAPRRKITLVKETPRPKSPSPPEAQATNILLIKNLVRPFTLNQIKELLSRTGTIAENGFWMDRIKSKCFVEYANEDQAFETRQALHGISWPQSNPKKLIVEYAAKEDMEMAKELSKEQPAPKKTDPLLSADLWQQDSWSRDERPTIVNKITVIREWDVGKEDGQLHVKEKERERKELEKKKRQRSRSPTIEAHLPAPARKFKKKEEEPPTAKLLDDLFRKTKATPCIYWLPLTNEQIAVKEEIRRQHMAEHARRLEEMRRAERSRDTRRRRSPRK